jgi:hypothetical protein
MNRSKPRIVEWTMTQPWKDKLEKDSSSIILVLEGKPLLKKRGNIIILLGLLRILSEQGNKNLIGPNPIRQPGAREAYKGSLAPATS